MTETANSDSGHFDQRFRSRADRSPESDARVEAIDAVVRDIQAKYPFLEGATVFGSTVSGEAKATSDIDAFLFVNPDELPPEFRDGPSGDTTVSQNNLVELGRAIQVDILGAAGLEVRKHGKFEKNDVRVVPISKQLVKESVSKCLDQMDTYQTHKLKKDELYGTDEWLNLPPDVDSDEYIAGVLGEQPPYPDGLPWEIKALFHPAVGDTTKVNEYRRQIIDELLTSPAGQEIWEQIVSSLHTFEGGVEYGENNGIPATLTEAADKFRATS